MDKIKRWFLDSETIFIARLKVFFGTIALAIQFSGVDFSILTDKPALQIAIRVASAWLIMDGGITEWARRRNATDLDPGQP